MLWFVATLGIPLTFIAMLWIAISAFMSGNILWGVLSIVCAPLALVHGFQNYAKLKIPTIMMCVGLALNVLYGMLQISSSS